VRLHELCPFAVGQGLATALGKAWVCVYPSELGLTGRIDQPEPPIRKRLGVSIWPLMHASNWTGPSVACLLKGLTRRSQPFSG
jgi:hypothetical protein